MAEKEYKYWRSIVACDDCYSIMALCAQFPESNHMEDSDYETTVIAEKWGTDARFAFSDDENEYFDDDPSEEACDGCGASGGGGRHPMIVDTNKYVD